MKRFMDLLGKFTIILSTVLFVADFFIGADLWVFWSTGVILHSFTVGYSLYAEEGRKIWGGVIMGTVLGVFLTVAILRIY
ncbi:hypothetical protein [Halobacillus salinus]|uniref:Uncharacterized protein n=1 Tax=Halobacillus salinus TaxID=192814 RepID=A0A4Z0H101_9BACI|nr:hypothetical protein [Halobacillus salinus]TGB03659.1 hypothetical protein E4663_01250 [Halobacillus salinus]